MGAWDLELMAAFEEKGGEGWMPCTNRRDVLACCIRFEGTLGVQHNRSHTSNAQLCNLLEENGYMTYTPATAVVIIGTLTHYLFTM